MVEHSLADKDLLTMLERLFVCPQETPHGKACSRRPDCMLSTVDFADIRAALIRSLVDPSLAGPETVCSGMANRISPAKKVVAAWRDTYCRRPQASTDSDKSNH